jgi:hypothetical protein
VATSPFTRTYRRASPITVVKSEKSVKIAHTRANVVATVPPTESPKLRREFMTRILLLGLEPETVDFSDPALPPGMTVEKVRAGIEVALKQFSDRG